MPYIKRDVEGNIIGYALLGPPTAEEDWALATQEDSEEIDAYLNPVPTPQPDWGAFRMAMLSNPDFQTVVGNFTPLQIAAIAQIGESTWLNVAQAWNGLIRVHQPVIAGEAIAQWNGIAVACHCPLRFGEDGRIEG